MFTKGEQYFCKNPKQNVKFSIITTAWNGECYQLEPMGYQIVKGAYEAMVIHNLTDKISYEVLKSIKVTYTSSKNAIGILGAFWLDGDVLDFELERDSAQEIGLRETETIWTIYLKEKSKCSSDSFYDCFLPKFLEKDS